MSEINRELITEKWAPVLDHANSPKIKDQYRREVTAILLENQEKFLASQSEALFEATHANAGGGSIATGSASGSTGAVAGFDPILISLVRRSMPLLMAYDICGVQPMTMPTGLIFAMKSKYTSQNGTEALFNEADSDFSGAASPVHAGSNPVSGTFTTGVGMSTATAEGLGDSTAFNQMAFSIEKTSVVAKSRALKAEYTIELAQDLKNVHGLNAEAELSNILSTEILAEINREVVRTIYTAARTGCQTGTVTQGVFDMDVDSNGRWLAEKFKGLLFKIDQEANVILQQTRRGRGNFIVCSADVASALNLAGVLDYAPALSTGLDVDESSSTFAGILQGRYKVYIDPYIANGGVSPQFALVGYKGSSAYDAGLFYCPYVPLQKLQTVDPNTFQPKIAFKTRYGMVANPFCTLDAGADGLAAGNNYYYRKFAIANL